MQVMTKPAAPSPPKTNTQRQADFKARMRAAGMQQVTLWIHRDDADALRAHADKLTAKRGKGAKP